MMALASARTRCARPGTKLESLGFTESMGLGRNRLTEKGRDRARELRRSCGRSGRWAGSQVRFAIGPPVCRPTSYVEAASLASVLRQHAKRTISVG